MWHYFDASKIRTQCLCSEHFFFLNNTWKRLTQTSVGLTSLCCCSWKLCWYRQTAQRLSRGCYTLMHHYMWVHRVYISSEGLGVCRCLVWGNSNTIFCKDPFWIYWVVSFSFFHVLTCLGKLAFLPISFQRFCQSHLMKNSPLDLPGAAHSKHLPTCFISLGKCTSRELFKSKGRSMNKAC